MVGIVFSTLDEAQPFLDRYERGRFDGLAEGDTLHDEHFLVTITGIGKIKSTLRTERMLQHYQPTRLVHVGTCTSLNEGFSLGTLIAADQVFEGDRIELSTPTYPRMPLDVPFSDLPTGTLVTQDHTVQEQSEFSYWQRIADITDMAGYAIAYVAATHGVPCNILKAVTGYLQRPDKHLQKTLADAYESLAGFLITETNVLRAGAS